MQKNNINNINKYENMFGLSYFEFNLLILIQLFSLILKLYSSSNFILIFLSSIFEFLIIFYIFIIIKKIENKTNEPNSINLFLKIGFYIILIIDTSLNLVHSYFLDEANLLKYNIYTFDIEIAKYFINKILPSKLIIISILIVILIIIFSWFFKYTNKIINEKLIKKKVLWILFVLIILTSLFSPFFSNIYFNSILEFNENINNQKLLLNYEFLNNITNNKNNSSILESKNLNQKFINYSSIKIKKEQIVLIFIMESVPYDILIKESENIKFENNYFKQSKKNTHTYTNYYTTNQDSLTSILTILSSIFIPYDAYANNWYINYGKKLGKEKNLIEFFNINNYSTELFISSEKESNFLNIYNWKNKNLLGNYSNKSKKYLCLQAFEYQKACEDKAILNDIKSKILEFKSNNKNNKNIFKNKTNNISSKGLFLFQELIYGHSIKYQEIKKQSSSSYYNEYFLEIYNFLLEENLLENTTIIITSDHGYRNLKNRKKPFQYQIPLMIYNKDFSYKENNNLFNHIDFKNIIINEININYQNKTSNNKNNDIYYKRNETYFIGQTRSNIFGYINQNKSSFTIKKNNEDLIIIDENKININLIKEKTYLFLEYISKFKDKYQS